MNSSSIVGSVTAGLILAIVAILALYNSNRPTPAEVAGIGHERALAELDARIAEIRSAGTPKLRLGSWRCYTEHGYWYVAGTVTNISDGSLDNVTATASFETKDGQFVKNDQAMIEYQPIMAGQTSPFTVITMGNPAIAVCRLAFSHLFGAAIAFER